MHRTKIVCTLGPNSRDPQTVEALIRNGMDVARLNFSHGEHSAHRRVFECLRETAERLGRNVAVLMDLQGPKIRTGTLVRGEPVELVEGAPVCLTTDDVQGTAERLSTTYQALPNDVGPGDRILLADGSIELTVDQVVGRDVLCRVVQGGSLGEHKGINLPGVAVSAPAMTEKDCADLAFGLELGVDYVALSFVRSPDDIRDLRARMREHGKEASVIAKIERPEALEHFDEILSLVDGIMVARGDLGVEVDLDDMPQIQKTLIRMCNRAGVPVITATQMLESMMTNPRPTRAEVNDVANAIYDGTDAVMLSGETAVGRFPVKAVQMMAATAAKADAAVASSIRKQEAPLTRATHATAIGQAVAQITDAIKPARIVCFSATGYTAAMIARFRPRIPITAITANEEARRRCALYWGVEAVRSITVSQTDEMVRVVDETLLREGLASPGDTVVIVAGTPLLKGGQTNLLKLHRVGEETSNETPETS